MCSDLNHDAILTNRAARTEAAPEEVHCTVCNEPLVFGMRDTHHEFSVGLTTVLECLYAAEKNGYTPALPGEWWVDIESTYHLHLPPLKENAHGCVQAENNGSRIQKNRTNTI